MPEIYEGITNQYTTHKRVYAPYEKGVGWSLESAEAKRNWQDTESMCVIQTSETARAPCGGGKWVSMRGIAIVSAALASILRDFFESHESQTERSLRVTSQCRFAAVRGGVKPPTTDSAPLLPSAGGYAKSEQGCASLTSRQRRIPDR